MSSLLIERVISHVASLGYGSINQDLFPATLPAHPDVATGVIATGGYSRPRDPIKLPSFQILHRNTKLSSGLSFVTSLHAALTNGASPMCSMPGFFETVSDPGPHYLDDNQMLVFTLNLVYRTTRLK